MCLSSAGLGDEQTLSIATPSQMPTSELASLMTEMIKHYSRTLESAVPSNTNFNMCDESLQRGSVTKWDLTGVTV